MHSSVEFIQKMVENSPDAIFLIDAGYRVLYAGPSTVHVLGYEPEDVRGGNLLDLVHSEDRGSSVHALSQALAEPASQNRWQARIRRKDGAWLWVDGIAHNFLEEPHIGGIVIYCREIMTKRQQNQHLFEEPAHYNAPLEEFAYGIAHDLKEPLRTVGAFTELLVSRGHIPESETEIAQLIVQGVQRMHRLLDGFLASTHAPSAESSSRPVELERAASLAIANLNGSLAASGANVVIESLPTVEGNECDLVRLFQNLIGNAVKYRSEAPVVVSLSAEQSGPDWVIKVHDNGIGIPEEHCRRIFDRFSRLHSAEIPGSGIGLAICKKIVEAHGGTIWVESRAGAGSTFCFTVAARREDRGILPGPPAHRKRSDPARTEQVASSSGWEVKRSS